MRLIEYKYCRDVICLAKQEEKEIKMESTLKRHSKHLPLRKRGIEGDLSLLITVKKDTPHLFQGFPDL